MWPGNPWERTRTVILSKKAQAFVDENMNSAPRFRDIWESGEGIEWLLARKPTMGMPRGPRESAEYWLYSIASNEIAQTRPMAILYSFNDNFVTIHAVRFTDNF